jgi:hypothetical protein
MIEPLILVITLGFVFMLMRHAGGISRGERPRWSSYFEFDRPQGTPDSKAKDKGPRRA